MRPLRGSGSLEGRIAIGLLIDLMWIGRDGYTLILENVYLEGMSGCDWMVNPLITSISVPYSYGLTSLVTAAVEW